jgi:phosphoadenosine phosphosulfate reductase
MIEAPGPIWRDGAFQADTWVRLEAEGPLPTSGEPLLASLAVFLAEPERLLGYNGPLGVEIAAGDAVEPLVPHLSRIALIALAFPKFSDGRNYSTARLLRERHGFTGELRAVGEVLSDQIPLMRRCGIQSFEVHHAPTRKALASGHLAEVRHYYQPVAQSSEVPAGTRPWLRLPTN